MKRIAMSLSLSLALFTSGCFGYGVQTGARGDGVVHATRHPVLAWGLVGHQSETPECPNGVVESRSSMPWWGGPVALLTVGIVVPWRVEYVCAAPASSVASSASDTAATE